MSDTAITTVNNASLASYEPSNYTTFDLSTVDKKIVANAATNAGSLAEACGSEPFEALGFMMVPGIRRARRIDESDKPCTDTTIILEDGSAVFTKSEGIRRALDKFAALGIFDGSPVKMRVVEKTIAGGNTMKTLELV